MPRIVVLGAGTGVGKTWITAALTRALGERLGLSAVLALKPIESGLAFEPKSPARDTPRGSDAEALETACGRLGRIRPHPRYGFADALSPHLAAARANEIIDLEAITTWVQGQEQAAATPAVKLWCLIETAGGAFSPLSLACTNVDLALALRPDLVILVGADRLGVLHDMAAAVIALSTRGVSVHHIVLSEASVVDGSTGTNARELKQLRATLGLGSARVWSVARDRPEQLGALADWLQAESG